MPDVVNHSISVEIFVQGLPCEELFRVDIGEQANAELGKRYFEAGEQMQFVCLVAGLQVWIYRDARMGWYKVAFGAPPTPFHECEWLSRDEAEHCVMKKVMEVSHV
jgi:hypothetical protein